MTEQPNHVGDMASDPSGAVTPDVDLAPTSDADQAPALCALIAAVEELRSALTQVRVAYADQRALLARLHEENAQLRAAAQNRVQDPMVRDLISLADTCLRTGGDWSSKHGAQPADVERALAGVAEDIGLILDRQGVEAFQPEPGTLFDRREARAVRSIDTPDQTRSKLVANVLRPGYRFGDRVLRPAEVVVWKPAAAPDPDDAPPADSTGASASPDG